VREPIFRQSIHWCPECNVPLIASTCGCGTKGVELPLLKPYDVRPALSYDRTLLLDLLNERFGINHLPEIILFNKTGGLDRNDLIIINGQRFGWLAFDPFSRNYSIEITSEGLAMVLEQVQHGIVDITEEVKSGGKRRIGGKKIPFECDTPDGPVLLKSGALYGTGILQNSTLRIKKIGKVEQGIWKNPSWDDAIRCNKPHLKNLERHAIRFIKHHRQERPNCNVSFSGGKDSTVVYELARRAGVTDSYFVDTGMEFPETVRFVKEMNIPVILQGPDFTKGLEMHGLPKKDSRWCCEYLKLETAKRWLEKQGPCVTVQGNRWYESFARSTLPGAVENPFYPKQLNLSPIRAWRALEVFLYIWWRELPVNPLYDQGLERVGCWMCPAMLEAETEIARKKLPDSYAQWDRELKRYTRKEGMTEDALRCGLWRWKSLPPKMLELVSEHKIKINTKKQIKK